MSSQETSIPEKYELQIPKYLTDKADKPAGSEFVGFVSAELRHLALQNPSNAARVLLSNYRREYGRQGADAWLEHFAKVHAACVATFPENRQPYALKNYGARYCVEQTAQVIAVHTIALELWAQDKRTRPYGVFLEASCEACGIDVAALPENELTA